MATSALKGRDPGTWREEELEQAERHQRDRSAKYGYSRKELQRRLKKVEEVIDYKYNFILARQSR